MYVLLEAKKSDKKTIKRFYKTQHYSAAFIGYDKCYYFQNNNEEIIAAVIVSYVCLDNKQALLHALVVDKAHRNKSLALKLIAHCLQQHPNIVCFARAELSKLYLTANMTLITANKPLAEYVSPTLISRYNSYQDKTKDLLVFISNTQQAVLNCSA